MVSLLVASTEPAGKTAICAGTGRKLIEKGKKVGYLRPVTLTATGAPDYQDAATIKEALELSETLEALSPLHLSAQQFTQTQGLDQKIKTAFAAVPAGKDIVVAEGLSAVDEVSGKFNAMLADLLDAKVITIVRYTPSMSGASAAAGKVFGNRWLGAIVTAAPDVKAMLAKDGVKVLGIVPEDRTLFGISCAEVAKLLEAKVVTGAKLLDKTIENVLLGAMTVDSGLEYFNRKDHKAAIIRGDRPDMALAALQTNMSCLILTGGAEPPSVVVRTADDKKVPVLLVKQETPAVVELIEKALPQAKFRGAQKVDRLDDLVAKSVDFDGIFKAIGI
ncbi:MAG: DRTGG domain-containing protein [Chloroflexota bacterium]